MTNTPPNDQEMLQGENGVTVTLCGRSFWMPEPRRRQARRLMAGIMRLAPTMSRLYAAIKRLGISDKALKALKAGKADDATLSALSALPPDVSADMFALYDPLCEFLQDCIPDIPDAVLDDADEAELMRAFAVLRKAIEAPFMKSANGRSANKTKKTPVTRQPSTSANERNTA